MANEKRLIDANALRERMFSYYGCVNENSSKEYYRGETLMNYEVAGMIEDCIDNAPTVDAVEVVHGRWIRKRYDDICGGWWNEWTCSRCDWKIRENPKEFNYCPNCGADMRERKDNENP